MSVKKMYCILMIVKRKSLFWVFNKFSQSPRYWFNFMTRKHLFPTFSLTLSNPTFVCPSRHAYSKVLHCRRVFLSLAKKILSEMVRYWRSTEWDAAAVLALTRVRCWGSAAFTRLRRRVIFLAFLQELGMSDLLLCLILYILTHFYGIHVFRIFDFAIFSAVRGGYRGLALRKRPSQS